MMINENEITSLKLRHKTERDGRVRDRIKAVILHAKGWSNVDIATALLVNVDTVGDHIREYEAEKKLKPENGGSNSLLNPAQTEELISHLEVSSYVNTADICAYVKEHYGIIYTISGMTSWLHRNKFSYKQPKGTPAKANPEKQAQFVAEYNRLLNNTPEDEPILFADGVHPTQATKLSYGWIRTGQDKLVATTGSRTRINIFGSLNLADMSVLTTTHETIDSIAIGEHFEQLKKKYPLAKTIHLILDQGSYNTSNETKEKAEKYGIKLHYLPPYSPNLNPIERLWKVMNEHARNNKFFATAKEFRSAINNFFEVTWPKISISMVDRINDSFEVVKTVT
jgi:transposase